MLPIAILALSCLTGDDSPAAVAEPIPEVSWIPFDLYRDRMIFLKGKINGVEIDFLLDSGAGMTCMSEATAKELALEGGFLMPVGGTGGIQSAELFAGLELEVGDVHLEKMRVLAIDFTDVELQLGRTLPVVLGQEVFRKKVVDIDYPGRRVAFRDPESFTYEGDGAILPLHDAKSGLWSTELSVHGLDPVRILVDTGSNGTLSLAGDYARVHDLLANGRPFSTTQSGGVGGRRDERVTTLDRIRFGNTVFTNVPIRLLADEGEEEVAPDDLVGSLGGGLLHRFRVLFDVTRDRMILEESDTTHEPFSKDRVGLQTIWRGDHLEVDHVAPNSPAARAGLESGMVIRAIDGVPIGEDFWKAQHRWRSQPAGTTVVLRDDEGREHPLVRADFY